MQMKKYVRSTAFFLILLIAPVRTAFAYSEHHSYSSSHTEVWVDATGLAVLLGTLAAGNTNNQAEAAKQQAAY